MSSLPRPVSVVQDDVLEQNELDALLAFAISREPDFIEAHLVKKNFDAAPVVNRHFRLNKQLRGANSVPTTVMARIREVVPVLASELPGIQGSMVAEGTSKHFLQRRQVEASSAPMSTTHTKAQGIVLLVSSCISVGFHNRLQVESYALNAIGKIQIVFLCLTPPAAASAILKLRKWSSRGATV